MTLKAKSALNGSDTNILVEGRINLSKSCKPQVNENITNASDTTILVDGTMSEKLC